MRNKHAKTAKKKMKMTPEYIMSCLISNSIPTCMIRTTTTAIKMGGF
jgi:hypothetical protein